MVPSIVIDTHEIISTLENYPSHSQAQSDRSKIQREFNIDKLATELKTIYLSVGEVS